MLDPAGEEAYWRENYATQPFYEAGFTYDDYHPGYRTDGKAAPATKAAASMRSRRAEGRLRAQRRGSRLGWDRNRHAARAAWDRFDAPDPFERSQ
jgi:hypothetical protein